MAFDWKAAIGQLAPTIAGMIGTPVAGVAVAGLCNLLGLEPSPENAQKAAEQIAAGQLNGDQLVALRKLESDAKIQLAQMNMTFNLETQRLEASDTDSARKREMSIKDWTPRILAYGITLIWCGINGTLLSMAWHHNTPDAGFQATIASIMKTIDMALTFVLGYYYGQAHQQLPVPSDN